MAVRSGIDYVTYLFMLRKKDSLVVLIDFLIFAASAFSTLKQWNASVRGAVEHWSMLFIFLLSFVKFCWDTYRILDEFKSYFSGADVIMVDSSSDMCQLQPSRREVEMGYATVHLEADQLECVVYAKEQNLVMWDKNLNFTVQASMRKIIQDDLKKHVQVLVPFLSYQFNMSRRLHKQFINEQKLCLSTDIDIVGGKQIVCHKGSYFDTFVTNQICRKYLENRRDGEVMADARPFAPIRKDQDGVLRLHDLTTSMMNNEIGISTLAFTADNYLVLWRQNHRAQSSCNLLVPTGSGSCDWKDLKPSSDLRDTIVAAMQRELWEESGQRRLGVTPADVGETKVLGFFRWVRRGGKPEFVGVTKLRCNSLEVVPNHHEVRKNAQDATENMEFVGHIDGLPKAIANIRKLGDLSVPLLMCLQFLEDHYKSRPEELDDFLFRDSRSELA